MSKCNHPDCVDGVRYESTSFGLMNITKCEYCVSKEDSWEKSKAMMKAKFEALGYEWILEGKA